MTERQKAMLLDLKARQDNGEKMPCPRCGRNTMKPAIHTNALSRHADIYVCDECGTAEALLKFMSNPMPIKDWACFAPVQSPSDFKTLPVDKVWERVQKEHLSTLRSLYERWQEKKAYEDFEDYRAEAFQNCPGLTQLWPSPFRAEYEAADRKLVLRFRMTDDSVEVAADHTK